MVGEPELLLSSVANISGQFPGPMIEARPGDELEINVYNHVEDDEEGIAVHWHGLMMNGTNPTLD